MYNIVTAMKRGIIMIKVDKWEVTIEGKGEIVISELALLLHAMRNDYPQILLQAMEAEDKLYNIKRGM